jgi:amino acid transporter
MGQNALDPNAPGLQRHFGLLHATALNVSMIVGAGVFVTVPLMLGLLPGPYALLGWIAAGGLMLVDGLIWAELGAMLPGSGGSYLYLLEAYGRRRWGRLAAFLFSWQFLISGPLEVGSGLIAAALFSNAFHPAFQKFNEYWTRTIPFTPDGMALIFNPSRFLAFALGLLILALLYRGMKSLRWLTVTVWLGVLAVIVWILVEGALHFDPRIAFDFSGAAAGWPPNLSAGLGGLGGAMILAMYAYFGYYQVCYIGDEVRNPGKTIPRSILLSAALVCVLFIGVHLALVGSVPWRQIPTDSDTFNLPAEFMRRIHGDWAAVVVTAFLIWSCLGSVFAALLGYSRIPYAAARHGHFFAVFGRVHGRRHIPHVALFLVGAMTLFWTFFDLKNVINALIVTRILAQFIGQIVGVVLLRRLQPNRPRPFRMYLYPVPCAVALAGWLYMYGSAGLWFIAFGLGTLLLGGLVFVVWTWRTRQWPFGAAEAGEQEERKREDHGEGGAPPHVV